MSTLSVAGGTTIYLQQGPSTTVQWSTDNASWSTLSFPCTVVNTTPNADPVTVLINGLTFNSASCYFIAGSKNIQFNTPQKSVGGGYNQLILQSITNYPGLVQNGTSGAYGYDGVCIYNLLLLAFGSPMTLLGGSGWLGQSYFANGATSTVSPCQIVDCLLANGTAVPDDSGGVVGAYAAGNGGQLQIRACALVSPANVGNNGGGVVGPNSAYSDGSLITVERCTFYRTATMGTGSGGIFGNACGINRGTAVADKCYFFAPVGSTGGGIFGTFAGEGGAALAYNCYTTGTVAADSGGIFGQFAGLLFGGVQGRAEAVNCYATGFLYGGAGGIYAKNYSSTTATANHCYTTATVIAGGGGIWAGSSSDTAVAGSANNYAEGNHGSSGWKDVNAEATLTGLNTVWFKPFPSFPNYAWQLVRTVYSPYSRDLVDEITYVSVKVGDVLPGHLASSSASSCKFILGTPTGVSLNTSTGAITVLEGGTYNFTVWSNLTWGYYATTTFHFTVPIPPAPPAAQAVEIIPYPVPQTANGDPSQIVTRTAGRTLRNGATQRMQGIAQQQAQAQAQQSTGRTRTAYAQPTFPSYAAYMMYLQSGRGL